MKRITPYKRKGERERGKNRGERVREKERGKNRGERERGKKRMIKLICIPISKY